ncbi:hypothetical protein [Streptomyces sp. cmx-4-25]|uniref:hypothetical protein n=1 Tax=unclassified Streptomyces TaxID=2593676 RepID=UPI00397EE833
MTSEARRARPLHHVTATGTALAVALGPVLVGALVARSVGADPLASVNALIASGGQRARLSRAHLRTGAALRRGPRLRFGTRLRPGARLRARVHLRLPHGAGRPDGTGRGRELRDPVG